MDSIKEFRRRLAGKSADKNFWEQVRTDSAFEKYRAELDFMWKEYCEGKTVPALTYSDYRLYFSTGDRRTYETKYFARRKALDASALLSLIYPEKEEYLSRLMDMIYVICDEYTWCLPAHQGQNERSDRSHVDLFASETGFALAEILSMLEDRLDPLIRDRIEVEIKQRIEEPYLAKEPYSWWETAENNWAAVCTGSVACTLMLTDPETARSLIPRFERSMDRFLSGFSSEGICYEGPSYWKYGFGFFTVYADTLRRFTEGEYDRFREPKVRKIASYLQKIFLSGSSAASFSDGGACQSYHLGLQHFLAKEYPDDVSVFSPSLSYNRDECARFCLHLRSATWLDPDILKESENAMPVPAEYVFPEAEWMIKRTQAYGFAAKGGTNADPHNHNDVGSFIFAKNGRHCLTDPGPGAYTRQYFSSERYTFAECSSRGHSLPIIGGSFQKTGREFRAKDVSFGDGVFELDIAPAYGIPALRSLKRSFTLKEDGISVADRYVLDGDPGEITERFVTRSEPRVTEGAVEAGGCVMRCLTPGAIPVVSFEDATSGRIWYIDYVLPRECREFGIEIN